MSTPGQMIESLIKTLIPAHLAVEIQLVMDRAGYSIQHILVAFIYYYINFLE